MKQGVDYVGVTVVFFCHDGHGNFLMNKRSVKSRDEHGRWDPGGGAIHKGEKVLDAIRREIKEEYCTAARKIEFLGYRDVHRMHEGKKTHWIALDFKVLVDKNKVKNGDPVSLDEIGWFRINKLPRPLHSQMKTFLKNYKSRL